MLSGGALATTNNRMELLAVAKALFCSLQASEYNKIEICSDSAYVINALSQGWLQKWQEQGWKTATGDAVKNCDLWMKVASYLKVAERCNVEVHFVKVKGHDGDYFNEMVDQEARKVANENKKKVEAMKDGNDIL